MPPKKRVEDSDVDSKRKKRKTEVEEFVPENNGPIEDGAGDAVLEGSLISGELLFCGGTNWDLIGRRGIPKGVKNVGGPNLWGPHRVDSLKGVRIRTVASGCVACHCVAITTEGSVYSWGRNDKGQLGHGDILRRDRPTLIEALESVNIVAAACGRHHTLLISDRGTVYSFGCNTMGQLGLGGQSQYVPSPSKIKYSGPPIKRVSCGGEFSMMVDMRGNLYSFGHPEYGQLGHNNDGKYFVTSSKLTYNCEVAPRKVVVFVEKTRDSHVTPINDVDIVDVACGANHSVAIDHKKRLYTWGFGGYGRLGHAEQKDELVPRLVKVFDGPKRGAIEIAAGSSFGMAINESGGLFFWGQNKPTGEATMYPKPVMDLNGWKIRSIGCCNRSIVIAADNSIISWGSSPTYGELCLGDNKPKSSTTPQEAKLPDGIFIHKVSCGYAHTMLLAKCDSDEDKEILAKLPSFSPDV